MTGEQIRQARDLLTLPGNSISSIARLLGVSRSTIYKYLPDLANGSRPPAAQIPPSRPARPARLAITAPPTARPDAGFGDNAASGSDWFRDAEQGDQQRFPRHLAGDVQVQRGSQAMARWAGPAPRHPRRASSQKIVPFSSRDRSMSAAPSVAWRRPGTQSLEVAHPARQQPRPPRKRRPPPAPPRHQPVCNWPPWTAAAVGEPSSIVTLAKLIQLRSLSAARRRRPPAATSTVPVVRA